LKADVKRIEWVDFVKFVAIFYMVWAHCGVPEIIYWYIQSFHMPLFFFISGYLFNANKYNFKDYVIKRVRSLIIPYLLFGAVNYIFWVILVRINAFETKDNLFDPIKYLLTVNTTTHLPIANALWFLTCLFIVEIVFYILLKYIKNNNITLSVILIIFSLIGYFYPLITNIRLYWGIDVAFTAIVFYGFGYLFKRNENRNIITYLFNPKIYITILLFAISITFELLNGHVALMKIIYNNYFYYYISAFASIFVYITIAIYLYNIRFIRNLKIYRIFLYVGKNTISILAFNQLLIVVLIKITQTIPININIKQLINSILIIVILIPISYLLNKYCPIIVGKSIVNKK
jgi:acyltransferase